MTQSEPERRTDPSPAANDPTDAGRAARELEDLLNVATQREGRPGGGPSRPQPLPQSPRGTPQKTAAGPAQPTQPKTRHPEWKDKQPFQSLLAGDVKGALAGGQKAIVELLAATHTGITTAEFEQIVADWIKSAVPSPADRRPILIGSYCSRIHCAWCSRINAIASSAVLTQCGMSMSSALASGS